MSRYIGMMVAVRYNPGDDESAHDAIAAVEKALNDLPNTDDVEVDDWWFEG